MGWKKVWRRIEIGWQTTESLCTLCTDIFVSPNAQDLLRRISLLPVPASIKLAFVTNADLALPERATVGEVYQTALKRGLQLCHPEVGVFLRAALKRQARQGTHRTILIGMTPVMIPAYIGKFRCAPLDETRIFSIENHPKLGRALYAPDTAKGNATWIDPHVWAFQMA